MSDQQLGSGEWLHAVTICIRNEMKKAGWDHGRLKWDGKELWLTLPNGKRRIGEYAAHLLPIEHAVVIGY